MCFSARPVVRALFVWGVVSLFLAHAPYASAQSTDASIIGQVTDDSHAILPGVTVTATSPSLQVPSITTTRCGPDAELPIDVNRFRPATTSSRIASSEVIDGENNRT